MCIIIVKPKDTHITKAELKTAFLGNPDGAGFMYTRDNCVNTHKGFFGFRKFYKTLRQAETENPESPFVIHMRIATSGVLDVHNCHPFIVQEAAGFMHNGILTGLGNKQRSDTMEFVEDYLEKLPPYFWLDDKVNDKVEAVAKNSSSKFVLLDGESNLIIYNEKLGDWDNGRWFSNSSYKTLRTRYTKTITTTKVHVFSTIDKDTCELCGCKGAELRTMGKFSSSGFCKDCMEDILTTVQIECPNCGLNTSIDETVFSGHAVECDTCGHWIAPYEFSWQISRYMR